MSDPQPNVPQKSPKKWFCACKHTGTAPMCDGSHKTL
jgi:CDGSH-type Zn-finger protein